jgi:hypothetical protein
MPEVAPRRRMVLILAVVVDLIMLLKLYVIGRVDLSDDLEWKLLVC